MVGEMETLEDFYIDVFDHIFSLVKEHEIFDPTNYIDLFIQGNISSYNFPEFILNEFKNNNYGHVIKHGEDVGYLENLPRTGGSLRYKLTDLAREIKKFGGH